jgi:3-hydroxyisobutyrate dehydrogenase-like beta-hydroxyacid dehydrogenase
METIGLVGVGQMGSALLERLQLAGHTPTVYDANKTARLAAHAQGATVAKSPAEVARAATLVHVVVWIDDDVRAAVAGPSGVLEGARPGTLVLLHSTIHPNTTREIAAAAEARDVAVLDACMVGVPDVVRAGEVVFLVGGPPERVERARPHLLRLGRDVLHMGPLGAGNAAKIAKNLVTGAETYVIHEAIQIAAAAGIAYPDALNMLKTVYSGTMLSRWERTFDPSGASMLPRLNKDIPRKDLPLAARLASDLGVEAPIAAQLAAQAQRLWDEAAAKPPPPAPARADQPR